MKSDSEDKRVLRRCEKLAVLYSDYVDGDLDQAARSQVEEHLKTCAPCRLDIALMREITRNLIQVQEESLTEDFAAGVASLARQQQQDTPSLLESILSLFRLRTVVAVGAMAVLLALVIIPRGGLWNSSPMGPQTASGLLAGAQMEVLQGTVAVEGKPTAERISVARGVSMRAGTGARALLRFSTDTCVEFGPSTQLACVSEGVRLERGKVSVSVPKKSVAAGKPAFRVFTPNARVSVWGTQFTVRYGGTRTRVECKSGVVGVERLENGKVTSAETRIRKGQVTSVDGSGKIVAQDLKGPVDVPSLGPAATSEDTTLQLRPGSYIHSHKSGE